MISQFPSNYENESTYLRTYISTLMLGTLALKGVASKSEGACHQDASRQEHMGSFTQIAPHLQHSPLILFRSLIYVSPNSQKQMTGGSMCDFVCVCWLTHELHTHIGSVHTCETVNAHVHISIPTRGGRKKDLPLRKL